MVRIPKKEYLFGTASSVGDTASFGLDFGEIYKRSVIGVRVYGVPAGDKDALAAFFDRINRDYRSRARNTEYHDGETRYDYLRLNCAKTIGAAFKYARLPGPRRDERIASPPEESGSRRQRQHPDRDGDEAPQAVERARVRLDVVLYRKYDGSTYVTRTKGNVAFKDLPNRFSSVLSRDFRKTPASTRTSTISSRCTSSTTSASTTCASTGRHDCSRSRGERAR